MAGIQSLSFTSPGYDYSGDLADIERRKKLAEQLQQQASAPIDPNRSAGGWVIPVSPWEGAAKLAQGLASGMQTKRAREQEKELGQRVQGDYQTMLAKGLKQLSGTPETQGWEDPSGNWTPPQPAVKPDVMGALGTFGSHPMGAPFQGLAMQELSRQRLVDALRGPQTGAAPTQGGMPMGGTLGAPAQPGGQPGPQSSTGGPAGGVPMAAWLQADPSGKAYMEQLAKDFTESNKPQNVRPEGTIAVPDGVDAQGKPKYRQAYYSAKVGEGMTRGPEGGATMIPGYLEGQMQAGRTPMTQVTNANQTHSYVPNAQLAGAAMANPIPAAPQQPMPIPQAPGMQQVPQGAGAPGAAPIASPQAFPRETRPALQAAGQGQLGILQAEAQKYAAANQPIPPDLAQELANAQKRAGGVYPARSAAPPPVTGGLAASPPGPPQFGQTQEEQIRQARETAAGKAVDEQFAKDYVQFTTGGASDAAKQIAQLGDVTKALADPNAKLTGPFMGSVPDAALKFTGTGRNSIAMRERVEEVVQRSLRSILGAQFTEKEGERLIARAYNPSLTEKENAIRVGRLATQLQQAFASKQDAAQYFQKNNTLEGWKGKLPSISDFDPDAGNARRTISKPALSDATLQFLQQQGIQVP